jgi:acyl transferase domain-containing protein
MVKKRCSASLVALHEAYRALQASDILRAIAGGTGLIRVLIFTSDFFFIGALSPDCSYNMFDAGPIGFARAKEITAIYVKLFDDALRDRLIPCGRRGSSNYPTLPDSFL